MFAIHPSGPTNLLRTKLFGIIYFHQSTPYQVVWYYLLPPIYSVPSCLVLFTPTNLAASNSELFSIYLRVTDLLATK